MTPHFSGSIGGNSGSFSFALQAEHTSQVSSARAQLREKQ
jgi:hypothetical protein